MHMTERLRWHCPLLLQGVLDLGAVDAMDKPVDLEKVELAVQLGRSSADSPAYSLERREDSCQLWKSHCPSRFSRTPVSRSSNSLRVSPCGPGRTRV